MQNSAGRNTTITAVIVDRKIPGVELRQFGRQVHTSMAQVIRPFHTPYDGDILFSISVGDEPLAFSAPVAAEFASRLARQAIYSAVLPEADGSVSRKAQLEALRQRAPP